MYRDFHTFRLASSTRQAFCRLEWYEQFRPLLLLHTRVIFEVEIPLKPASLRTTALNLQSRFPSEPGIWTPR